MAQLLATQQATSKASGVPALPLPNGETAKRLLAPAWPKARTQPRQPPGNLPRQRKATGRAVPVCLHSVLLQGL